MVEGWRNGFREATNSKPLFVTIYATVIIGVLVSSFYVFSAVYSPTNGSTSWLSSPPLSSNTLSLPSLRLCILLLWQMFNSFLLCHVFVAAGRIHKLSQENATSQSLPVALPPPPPEEEAQGKSSLGKIWVSPPKDKKMPPLEAFKLTKELFGERVKDNVIIVTFGNYAFMDFILTWVKHLTDLDLSNILVGAMDTKLLEALYWKGVPVFDMGSHMSTVDVGWGSPTFHKMGREKVILIDSVLPFGYELLMCDTDMVWLKNPLPYLARYPDADLVTVHSSFSWTLKVSGAYNIGIFHWRPTESAKKLAKEWKDILIADDKVWDQNGFNEIVRRQLGPSVDGDSGLFYAYDGNLKVGILPASIFCSGHTYFVQAMYQQLRLEPYALHTTFQYAGTEGKRHRLREGMVFFDPPEYYDAPGGFISFKPSIPKSMLLDGNHTIESHFTLVNHQMKQIRSALAIASLLNRTLVMPPIWCRLDRLWFGHPGTLEGSMTRQPFICPLDHVFEVNIMLKEMPEEEFGPGIGIREYSFLDNPSLPKQVKESWLDVQLCQGCEASNITSSSGALKFPKRSNEDTFKAIFSSFNDVKVIKFSSVEDAFTGFSDKTPGHIYYDMYWDEKPGWKPVPPQTPEEDHPPL
ncbi:hypothetical protein DY000_02035324 [Brassica cretica]|uniref:Nucleotide-diphospho-sugar transferase domain-containing protein n=1 Tax=Brassica cretica TaxID=69181 RepID=A0ABQ7DCS5_BRACR|nr:hypothetical protein DY000_02035324 [Brassica cretica]